MTWNVWWRFGNWRQREPRIAETLAAVRPDVLGLQETWAADGTSQPAQLAELLGLPGALFVPTSLPPTPDPVEYDEQRGVEVGVGLVSRWPVGHSRVVPLPARHREPPAALHATLRHPAGPLHVVVACTEWKPSYADDHATQLAALAELLDDRVLDGPLPVLLLGDLNAAVDSAMMRPLLAVATDTWTAGGGDPEAVTLSSATPSAPLEATAQIDRRIDHVLARSGRRDGPVGVIHAFLAGDTGDGLAPSDHFAVVADLAPP